MIYRPPDDPGEESDEDEHSCEEHFCAKVSNQIKELGLGDSIEQDPFIDYRCVKCSKCVECKTSTKRRNISLKERREQEVIEKSVTVDVKNKRVYASLPFMVDPVEHLSKRWGSDSNYKMARARYNSTTKRPPEHKSLMVKAMKGLIESGFAVPLKDEPQEIQDIVNNAKVRHYYVINPVVNVSSHTTPVRLVVDPSATGLNETLACGENVTGLIADILIRNRFTKEAWTTDISKMYNQLYLNEDSFPYSLFLWSDDLSEGSDPQVYLMKRAWYGVVPTGNQASRGITMLAANNPVGYDLGVIALLFDRYVDDINSGADTKEAREEMIRQVEEILAQGGFKLKFVARSGEAPCEKAAPDGVNVKLLGYSWQPLEDTLKLSDMELNFSTKKRGKRKPLDKVPENEKELIEHLRSTPLTRKGILSKVAEVFDPVGIFEPLKLQMKLRLIPLNKTDWDEEVTGENREEWIKVFSQFIHLKDLVVNRYVFPKEIESIQGLRLIVISDAAVSACGVAVYAGVPLPDGTYSCTLITAKSRLVSDTIPRNELCSVLLGTEVAFHLLRTIRVEVDDIIYVTDSQITLCWVSNEEKKPKQFVSNRVAGIRQFIQWTLPETKKNEMIPLYHVEGVRNIADMLTKVQPFDVSSVGPSSDWINGFPWMRKPIEEMGLTHYTDISPPKETMSDAKKECFESPFLMNANLIHDVLSIGQIYEDAPSNVMAIQPAIPDEFPFPLFRVGWHKSLVTVAVGMSFVERLRHKSKLVYCTENCLLCRHETVHHEQYMERAERFFYKLETIIIEKTTTPGQRKAYTKVQGVLTYIGRFGEDTPVVQRDLDFSPFYDEKSFNRALVAVRPESEILRTYISYIHHKVTVHGSIAATISEVERKFQVTGRWVWMVSKYHNDCVVCRRLAQRTAEVRILSFPAEKAQLAPGFYNCLVDISFGFSGKPHGSARTTIKLYALVVVCLNTSAVAIWCLENLSTEEVCQALIRQGCRYGIPKTIFCDSGTQLVGLKHAKFSILDAKKNIYTTQGVDIRVGRPKAHSDRGRAEVRIKMLKEYLAKITFLSKNKPQTALQYETAFAQAANAMNNLPIFRANESKGRNRTFEVITPNRLLLGRNNHRALHHGAVIDSSSLTQELLESNNKMQEVFYTVLVAHMNYFNRNRKWKTGNFQPREGDLVLFLWNDALKKEFRLGLVRDFEGNRTTIAYPNIDKNGDETFKTVERSPRDLVILHREGETDHDTLLYWLEIYQQDKMIS